MNKYIRKTLILLITIAVLTALDQYTKYLAVEHLTGGSIDIISDFFKLDLLYNSGAAFGMLQNARILFCIITIILCTFIIIIYYRTPSSKKYYILKADLLVLCAGALGNFIDRMSSGQVVDFLSFRFGSYYFPTFNIADIYVTISGILLFILVVFYYKESELSELFHKKNDSIDHIN